jgi:ABC-2 type transport system ATP-binding protein|tara:strand:- start:2626 stop:3558 length:933 start_codon:yes stop_codon:yes gene_type:complete
LEIILNNIIEIEDVEKIYASGNKALNKINLSVKEGEILALLGPNGAGKTTLISAVCGITVPTSGSISVGGFDVVKEYKRSRKLIGLVPQEIALEPFEKVINTVNYSRNLFGYSPDANYIEGLLKKLSLWDKRNSKIIELSGGMKRRVLIAKALSHNPKILFLDEPTAGVDVELRKDMWRVIKELKSQGVTIILTTHYIEEAEEIAERIAIINDGQILLTEEKETLMERMGTKRIEVIIRDKIEKIPDELHNLNLFISDNKKKIIFTYDQKRSDLDILKILNSIKKSGLDIIDIETSETSLEDIFVNLVKD